MKKIMRIMVKTKSDSHNLNSLQQYNLIIFALHRKWWRMPTEAFTLSHAILMTRFGLHPALVSGLILTWLPKSSRTQKTLLVEDWVTSLTFGINMGILTTFFPYFNTKSARNALWKRLPKFNFSWFLCTFAAGSVVEYTYNRTQKPKVITTPDPIPAIAEAIHDGWWFTKEKAGHTCGPVKSRELKTHPHLLPWLSCGRENNLKDYCIAREILPYLKSTNNHDQEHLARLIHNSSVSCMEERERKFHPHAKHTWEDHDEEGREEHLTQSDFVLRVWKSDNRNST